MPACGVVWLGGCLPGAGCLAAFLLLLYCFLPCLSCVLAFLPACLQPLDQKSGMINIRADDDQEPEEVLAQFSLEQKVRPGLLINQAGADGAGRELRDVRSRRRGGLAGWVLTAVASAVATAVACACSPCCPQEALEDMRQDAALYDKMAASVAPNVHGHTDVKRAILLMLLGGMQKVTKEVSGWLAGAWVGAGGWVGGSVEAGSCCSAGAGEGLLECAPACMCMPCWGPQLPLSRCTHPTRHCLPVHSPACLPACLPTWLPAGHQAARGHQRRHCGRPRLRQVSDAQVSPPPFLSFFDFVGGWAAS